MAMSDRGSGNKGDSLWSCASDSGKWELEVSWPSGEETVQMVVPLLFIPYLVSSENGLSSPVCLGTVSPTHRPREDRPGAKTDTYISIFSTCQPENHLLLLPLSPAATAYFYSDL